jgi:hypothetical protein
MTAEDYAYLAGTVFRGVKRDYSNATANCGYVIPYINAGGQKCVLVEVSYKIVKNYTITKLYNFTEDRVYTDPSDYYTKLARRAYGATASYYYDLSIEALEYEAKALQGMADNLKYGTTNQPGFYVGAATLNG